MDIEDYEFEFDNTSNMIIRDYDLENDITKLLKFSNISTEAEYVDGDLEYDPLADNIFLITHYEALRNNIKGELNDYTVKRFFKNQVQEKLIAAAMHPCRIQSQMDRFEDIESYFEAMGC